MSVKTMTNSHSYIKRKAEQEASAAEARAVKVVKIKKEMSDRDMVFGPIVGRETKEDTGMGIKDEAMGMVSGGKGLKDVGAELE